MFLLPVTDELPRHRPSIAKREVINCFSMFKKEKEKFVLE